MFCPKCGTQNPDGAAFCAGCGNKLEDRTPAPAQTALTTAEPAHVPAATGIPQFSGGATAVKRGNKKLIIAGVVALLVVIGVGFGVYKAFFEPYPITQETFTDGTFRTYVLNNIDTDHDGKLSRDEAKAVTTLGTYNEAAQAYTDTLAGQSISSLKGIEYFTELTSLVANDNPLTSVDLTKNTKLEQVNLQSDTLQTLDVTGCNSIKSLWVSNNTQVTGVSSSLKENLMMTQYTSSYSGSSSSSTTTYTYTYALDGKLTDTKQAGKDYTYSDHYTYDANGNCCADAYTYKGSSSSSSTDYAYEFNELGLVAKKTNSTTSSGKEYTYTTTYTYDDAGSPATYTYTTMTGSNITYTLTQNYTFENGVPTAVTTSEKDYGTKSVVLSYNADGTCASAVTAYDSGSSNTYTYTYDEQGRLASETYSYVSSEGKTNDPSTTTYTWNADGTEMTETAQGSSSSNVYKYDTKGNLVEYCKYSNGSLSAKYTFTYTKGSLMEKEVVEYYNTSKNTMTSSSTMTATYAKLYSTTDYENRVSDYQLKYPYQTFYFNGGMAMDNYFSRYAAKMTKTASPDIASEQFFQIHS